MRKVIQIQDKDANECWAVFQDDHLLSIFSTEEQALLHIDDVQLYS
jgi:hypothetical protein